MDLTPRFTGENVEPIGVRIYEFIKGKDFPLTKSTDKVGDTRVVKGEEPKKEVPEKPTTGLKRVDEGEEKALKGYKDGGVVDAEKYMEPYQEGGPVVGPGTGTSDSVPIAASDGEYVIKADVVRFLGTSTLDKLVQEAQRAMTMKAMPLNAAQAFYQEVAQDEVGTGGVTPPMPPHPMMQQRLDAEAKTKLGKVRTAAQPKTKPGY